MEQWAKGESQGPRAKAKGKSQRLKGEGPPCGSWLLDETAAGKTMEERS